MDKKNNINVNISYLRKSHKLSQSDLAAIIGKKTSVVSSYETGNTMPPIDIIQLITKHFNISIDNLVNGDLRNSDLIVNKNNNSDDGFKWYDEKGNEVLLPFNPDLLHDNIDKDLELKLKRLQSLYRQILYVCITLKENGIDFSEKEKIIFKAIFEGLGLTGFEYLRLLDKERKKFISHLTQLIVYSEDVLNGYIYMLKDYLGKPIRNYEELFK